MVQGTRTILVVDDEEKIREVLCAYLESKGYGVRQAAAGTQALEALGAGGVSLVLLDLMLPDLPGEEVCRRIRLRSRVPVIMLTAKAEEEELLAGLELGADDYITKPFSLREVAARVDAVLRRTAPDLLPLAARHTWGGGDLVVDFAAKTLRKGGVPVSLTPTEWNILSALAKYPGKVFSREELIQLALGQEFVGFDRAIDSHIKNLRHKIEDSPREPAYVLTVHGVGYRFGGGEA